MDTQTIQSADRRSEMKVVAVISICAGILYFVLITAVAMQFIDTKKAIALGCLFSIPISLWLGWAGRPSTN